MVLSNREKTIGLISAAISNYSLKRELGKIPENQSMIDFIMKCIPSGLKNEVTVELIDEIFVYVSKANLELS